MYHHRAGTPGGRDVERLLDGGRDVFHVLYQEVVLHAGARDAHRVAFLERIQPDGVGRHLAGDHHERDGIHVGGGDAGHRIGDAGPGGHERHAHLVGGASVAVGGVHRALLVTHQDVLDLVLLEQLVVDEQHGAPGVAEHVFDPLFLQAAHHDFGAGEFHGFDQGKSGNV